ncbi:SPARC-related modular calcium-binding protein 1 [Eumeta japonica]|uniref:SPARC-related modular calcium-binding protein 1 n=1 Tax=Eumeta variegata TaxID=151549 RepID=A0A4C1SY76_EUMVA|nr:SPARC-related modular calcium-binding protein 1 [Eumeta japonica]
MARVTACEEGGPRRPVCGSDGKTYSSKCQLMQVQCYGERIMVAHKGHCTEGQQACLLALRYALNAPHPVFVPRCRADGSYAAVQCSAGATASCWCVNPAGKPLANTAVRNGRPDCTPTGE